ncbi:MAG: diaminopimelate decarboxylase [Sphingopyxis sp.]
MEAFSFQNGEQYCEGVALSAIAKAVGTPLYVYSRAKLEQAAAAFRAGVEHTGDVHLAYAIKANPNLAVIAVLARAGYGADVVSVGEMNRALAGGVAAKDVVFSGVGKTKAEMAAALTAGVGQFNIESEIEGEELADVAAAMGRVAVAALRVNPDVDALTHAKISTGKADNKFGVPIGDAADIYDRLSHRRGLALRGIALHIGSQLLSLDPLAVAFTRAGDLLRDLRARGHAVTHVDLGGGLGVQYRADQPPPSPADYGAMVARITADWGVTLMFEPGRVIAANAGVMVSEVIRIKPGANHPFVIVDAAMNDLARPALYDAWHDITALRPDGERMTATIVGPICESSDTFATAREMDTVAVGDLLMFGATGAYGASMASTYNSRDMVPEVMVDGDQWAIVADRIPADTIMAAERVPDFLSA